VLGAVWNTTAGWLGCVPDTSHTSSAEEMQGEGMLDVGVGLRDGAGLMNGVGGRSFGRSHHGTSPSRGCFGRTPTSGSLPRRLWESRRLSNHSTRTTSFQTVGL